MSLLTPRGSCLPMGVLCSALLPSIIQGAHAVFTGAWPAAGVPAGLNHRGPPSPMCRTGTSSLSPEGWPVGHVPVIDNTPLAGTGGGDVSVGELELHGRSRVYKELGCSSVTSFCSQKEQEPHSSLSLILNCGVRRHSQESVSLKPKQPGPSLDY